MRPTGIIQEEYPPPGVVAFRPARGGRAAGRRSRRPRPGSHPKDRRPAGGTVRRSGRIRRPAPTVSDGGKTVQSGPRPPHCTSACKSRVAHRTRTSHFDARMGWGRRASSGRSGPAPTWSAIASSPAANGRRPVEHLTHPRVRARPPAPIARLLPVRSGPARPIGFPAGSGSGPQPDRGAGPDRAGREEAGEAGRRVAARASRRAVAVLNWRGDPVAVDGRR